MKHEEPNASQHLQTGSELKISQESDQKMEIRGLSKSDEKPTKGDIDLDSTEEPKPDAHEKSSLVKNQ